MKKQYLLKLLVVSLIVVLALTAASPVFSAPEKVRVFVEFTPNGRNAVQNALNGAGAEFHYTFDHLSSYVVTLPKQALKGLAKNPNVVGIEEDPLRYPVEAIKSEASAPAADIVIPDGDTIPYGVENVQALDLWDTDMDGNVDDGANAGSGVKVCIIDTGYYGDHEDLPDLNVVDDGISLVDDNWYEDGYGHGSHVAGTIAAQDNNEGVIGVAPNASFFIVKYFDNDGLYVYKAHASDLVEAAITCADNGAKIISMSLSGTNSNGREKRTFDMLYEQGVLSIAAASNDGIDEYHYPASYDSVVSVAAVDEDNVKADFSQFNDQVELAAPGVAVLSTIPYIDEAFVTVAGVDYQANPIEYAARGVASGMFADGGLCDTAGDWTGMVVLCQRGEISFLEKVMNVQESGGTAAVIYNNEPGNFWGTLGDEKDSSEIVAVSISQEDGGTLVASYLGDTATVTNEHIWPFSGYEAWDGTSMATPHVSAVAALLWSEVPDATNVQIREAMDTTAYDLGDPGRDVEYGYGLVQAADALETLLDIMADGD